MKVHWSLMALIIVLAVIIIVLLGVLIFYNPAKALSLGIPAKFK